MKAKIRVLVFCGLGSLHAASCGFKSDLYLPGQPEKLEQLDSESLENLSEEKLRQLKTQTDSSDAVVQPLKDVQTGAAVVGVNVVLPSSDASEQQKSDARKKLQSVE